MKRPLLIGLAILVLAGTVAVVLQLKANRDAFLRVCEIGRSADDCQRVWWVTP